MAGTATSPVICWDSNAYIGYFAAQEGYPLAPMRSVLRAVKEERAIMLVSAVTVAEVLDVHGRGEAARKFREFIQRRSVRRVNIDFRIAELAAEFRERTCKHPNVKGLCAPDALILASASFYQAKAVQTKEQSLIKLSGMDEVNQLQIESFRPFDNQLAFDDIDPATGGPYREIDLGT